MKSLETLIKNACSEFNPNFDLNSKMDLSPSDSKMMLRVNLASRIDHTHLKNDSSEDFIRSFIEEGKIYHPASICIHPKWVSLTTRLLKTTPAIKVCTVVGFPLGQNLPKIKAIETKIAIEDGATEIDMVIDVGALKEKNFNKIYAEISEVREACFGKILKIIIETCLLTSEEIYIATLITSLAGADFVKTSTGFSLHGAKESDLGFMKKAIHFLSKELPLNAPLKIKASGGIRDYKTALSFINLGADRIGTSSTKIILEEASHFNEYEKAEK